MEIQRHLLKFVIRTNWILLCFASLLGLVISPPDFARGIIFGGLIVTLNFLLLSKTLQKALTPPYISSYKVVLAKYYVRFVISGFIIFVLIAGRFVDPLGLIIGLSIVVASIILATMCEVKKLIVKEPV